MVIGDINACSSERCVETLFPPTRICVIELKQVNLFSNANNSIKQFGKIHMLNQIPTHEYNCKFNVFV